MRITFGHSIGTPVTTRRCGSRSCGKRRGWGSVRSQERSSRRVWTADGVSQWPIGLASRTVRSGRGYPAHVSVRTRRVVPRARPIIAAAELNEAMHECCDPSARQPILLGQRDGRAARGAGRGGCQAHRAGVVVMVMLEPSIVNRSCVISKTGIVRRTWVASAGSAFSSGDKVFLVGAVSLLRSMVLASHVALTGAPCSPTVADRGRVDLGGGCCGLQRPEEGDARPHQRDRPNR